MGNVDSGRAMKIYSIRSNSILVSTTIFEHTLLKSFQTMLLSTFSFRESVAPRIPVPTLARCCVLPLPFFSRHGGERPSDQRHARVDRFHEKRVNREGGNDA